MEQAIYSSPAAAERSRLAAAEKAQFSRRKITNVFVTGLLATLTLVSVGVLTLILMMILVNGIGSLDATFFTQQVADGGIANSIEGTLIMVLMGAVIAIPLGLLTAIYLSEYGSGWLADAVRWALDLLAQMPSIVIGLFYLAFIYNGYIQYSGLTGALALATIMLPIIGRTTEEILRLVPNSLREGALALGTPRWRVVTGVVLPTVLPGLSTGIILAIARAAGETAPILLAAQGSTFFEANPMNRMDAIPLRLYRLALYTSDPHLHAQAWSAALILVFAVAIFSALVRFITGRLRYES